MRLHKKLPEQSHFKCALFILPTDTMGGAEKVTRILAAQAAEDEVFEEVKVFVLSGKRTGTLDALEKHPKVQIQYSGATRELTGLYGLLNVLAKQNWTFVFSSHSHINALLSALRGIGVLRAKRLVTRESTMVFDRDFGSKGILIRLLYRLYGHQDLIICQTQRMARSLSTNTRGVFDNKIRHIPNPIDFTSATDRAKHSDYTSISSAKNDLIICWCGRLTAVKAPELAIETISAIKKRDINAKLLLMGEGALRDSLKKLAFELEVSDSVEFLGYVKDPSKIFRISDVGLVTSLVEGFPNVVLEMLASGVKAIVTTNCAGGLSKIPDVQLVLGHKPELFADAISEIAKSGFVSSEVARNEFLKQRTPKVFMEACLNK